MAILKKSRVGRWAKWLAASHDVGIATLNYGTVEAVTPAEYQTRV
jgi:hypothetical protein